MQGSSAYKATFLIAVLYLFCHAIVYSQISSSRADFSGILDYNPDTVAYPDALRTDPYFIFNAPNQGDPVSGSLTAVPPGGTPGYDFSWSRYNPAAGNFDPPFRTDNSTATSTVEGLIQGAYRVRISSADLDTVFRAWVFLNDPFVEVEKGPDGKVMPYRYTCDFLRLVGAARADTLTYYELSGGAERQLPNGMSFEWTSDDPEYEITGADRFLSLTIYNQPPFSRPPTSDTRFTLTAVDSFNVLRGDDVLYESVHVKAEFEMWFEDRSDPESEGEWTQSDNPEEEAPMEVRFNNLSENGVEFEWSLVDSAKTGETAEFRTFSVDDSLSFIYYIPGYYYPGMIAYSAAGCVDSFPVNTTAEIHVRPSELDAPNVFTPNGDGVNDYFVVRSQSLKAFRITIYSQAGSKVYEYVHKEGRFEWEGWDGTIHGNGRTFASPGVYYYVIDALGWDGVPYRGHEPFIGFVYLIREAD